MKPEKINLPLSLDDQVRVQKSNARLVAAAKDVIEAYHSPDGNGLAGAIVDLRYAVDNAEKG